MNNEMNEIYELRQQMAAMKRSLDKYAIVNENLICTVLKKRSQGLNWFVNTEIIVLPVLCLFFFGLCSALHLSIWLAITMSVACVLSTIVDTKTMRVPKKLISEMNLSQLRTFLVRQKRYRTWQLIVELPLSAAWIVWFMLEYLSNDVMFETLKDSETFAWIKLIIIAVMLLLVTVIIMVLFKKSQGVNDAMLRDIEAIEDSSEADSRL